MYKSSSVIAIIPARSGSKGLKNKNILNLNGLPLISWSIKEALESQYIDQVVVSTDSVEIQEIAIKFGAEAPILRPPKLADDSSQTYTAIEHMLDFYKISRQQEFEFVVLLEPTSPLRTFEDIDNAIEKLGLHPKATSIVGVGRSETQHPDFLVNIGTEGFISSLAGTNVYSKRRQDISPVFFLEGSIYISRTDSLREFKSFYQDRTIAVEFPKWKTFEIDDLTDFLIVEKLLQNKSRLM
jgi:N-acylneuraminate cytidylyltransferase/CMP-N,N'-diacetyllegionaminic acid synthase